MNTAALSNEPMAKHTSWRLGGPADIYFRPESREELRDFLQGLDAGQPIHWVGLGSNLLVRDGGIRGVVIATATALSNLSQCGDGIVEAEAGVPCAVLARRCAKWGIGPAEFFAGIPGTVGGALTMNAGAFGSETWNRIVSVETMNRRGEIRTRNKDEFEIGYRQVRGVESEWFISARFKFEEQADGGLERVRALLRERQQKQPLGLPSCGSVFRNPPGQFAAQLIETSGLKGYRIGGAQVSEKHANFIINTGSATAADVEALIDHIGDVVKSAHGIVLVPEVHIVGDPASSDGD